MPHPFSGPLLNRQQHALTEAGCFRIFADKLSGRNADRPELTACLDYLRPGDTLVVPSLDRLSRSLADLIALTKSLHEGLAPGGSRTWMPPRCCPTGGRSAVGSWPSRT
jgi:Resolvase, N terminal domain